MLIITFLLFTNAVKILVRIISNNLFPGVVESTENIYRYHMQLQQGSNTTPGTRGPPQPQVQTMVIPEGAKQHSRSSSHSSQQSAAANTEQSAALVPA